MSLSNPVLTGPGGGRTVESGHGSSAELKIAGEQSGGEWAVVEWRIRAGDEPPIHTHTREDETIYVLDGAITAFVADQRIEVEAGSYAALPKNVPHGLSVRGEASPVFRSAAGEGSRVTVAISVTVGLARRLAARGRRVREPADCRR